MMFFKLLPLFALVPLLSAEAGTNGILDVEQDEFIVAGAPRHPLFASE